LRNIVINGIKVLPGQEINIDISISRLPSHTLIDLPVFVFRGKKEGPSILLTAGIHGDEVNGIEIIRRLLEKRLLMPEKGTVIAIPLVNIYGFIHTSRSLPDGKDLNRCFPGSRSGSLANQLAYMIMKEIIPNIDCGIDFHTGGSRITNYPHLRCVLSHPYNIELASMFGAPYIMNSDLIDKSFRKETFKKGKTILVYEGGESLRLDEKAINEGMKGVIRLMNNLGMTKRDVEHQISVVLTTSNWIRAKVSGIFNSYIEYGQEIAKNQTIGCITDPYGKSKSLIRSTNRGYVLGMNNMPVINAGDALFHIGF
jgi:uncharacterized protein